MSHVITTLVAITKAEPGNPIGVFQIRERITEGDYIGQRKMYAQRLSKTERKSLVISAKTDGHDVNRLVDLLGCTFIAEEVDSASGFTRLTNFLPNDGLTLRAEPQDIPSWIFRYASDHIAMVEGMQFNPVMIRRALTPQSQENTDAV